MKEFSYQIQDEVGMHARPARLLVLEAQKYTSSIQILHKEKSAAATQLMKLMSLGIKHGDEIKILVEGSDEEDATQQLQVFFQENL